VIGADWLIYQDLEDLKEAVHRKSKGIDRFDCSCFDGDYVTGGVTEQYLEHIQQLRNDSAKQAREEINVRDGLVNLYNAD